MTGTQLVVFDVDGTLVDSQHLIVAAMEAGFRVRACRLRAGPRSSASSASRS